VESVLKKVLKKRILISPEQQVARVGSFFREIGFELDEIYDQNCASEYYFIVDDYLPDFKNLPRIQTRKFHSETSLSEIRAFIDEAHLDDQVVKSLLKAYYSESEDFDLIDRFSKNYKTSYEFKIHDYLNVGYFIDKIIVKAYTQKFDFELIRNYLNEAIPFALKQVEKGQSLAPVDVSFSFSDTGFAILIALNASDFNFKDDPLIHKFFSSDLSDRTNFLDINFSAKKKRLLLSSLWFKDEKLKDFKSFFFSEITRRKNQSDSLLINVIDENESEDKYSPEMQLNNLDSSKHLIHGVDSTSTDNITIKSGDKNQEDPSFIRVKGSVEENNEDIIRLKSSGASEDESSEIQSVQKTVSDVYKEKLEKQLIRMKAIIEQMKAEIIRLRALDAVAKKPAEEVIVVSNHQVEIKELKDGLRKSLDLIKNLEKRNHNLKLEFETVLKEKEDTIQILDDRLQDLEAQISGGSSGVVSQKDGEISKLKETVLVAQTIIDKLKKERNELESKYNDEKVKLSKLLSMSKELDDSANRGADEKDVLINNLLNEKKQAEEKSKTLVHEYKKLEQKMKFTVAQLEESLKKKSAPASKGNDAHSKQLEVASNRIAEANADVVEKKKEIIKLKQENASLVTRLSEAERKLGLSDKKAS
jgi:hypothetical protein